MTTETNDAPAESFAKRSKSGVQKFRKLSTFTHIRRAMLKTINWVLSGEISVPRGNAVIAGLNAVAGSLRDELIEVRVTALEKAQGMSQIRKPTLVYDADKPSKTA